MKQRLLLILLCGFAACGPSEPRADAPLLKRWQKWPLDVALSERLSPCQLAGMRASATYWTSLLRRDVAVLRTVPSNDVALEHATRHPFTVAVIPGMMDRPDILDQVELFELKARPGWLHSAEVRVQGCSMRAFAHEFGHVLGLGHALGYHALMRIIHTPDAWDVSVGELGLLSLDSRDTNP